MSTLTQIITRLREGLLAPRTDRATVPLYALIAPPSMIDRGAPPRR